MSELYDYFKKLSEGQLDVTKTVEYQFIKKLEELDTPISLNNFAKELNLTSIIVSFLNLMAKGGLIRQSPIGIEKSVSLPNSHGTTEDTGTSPMDQSQASTLNPTPQTTSTPAKTPPSPTSSIPSAPAPSSPSGPTSSVASTEDEEPQSSDPQINEAVNKLKQMTSKLREQQIKEEQERAAKSSANTSSGNKPLVPRPNIPKAPVQTKEGDVSDEEVPSNMKAQLELERAKTGSKKKAKENIDDIFGTLGSLEDELDD